MDPTDKPEAFGVFKPVGHVVISFANEGDAQAAVSALDNEGFAANDIVVYSPEQMVRQADHDIEQAGALASLGQELNLVKAHRELAEQGHSFVIVNAPKDEATQRVGEIAQRHRAVRAQKYGRLMIEELIDVGSDDRQVAESPDRGLDAQTRSGNESGGNGPRG